jgi:hypothetical protein
LAQSPISRTYGHAHKTLRSVPIPIPSLKSRHTKVINDNIMNFICTSLIYNSEISKIGKASQKPLKSDWSGYEAYSDIHCVGFGNGFLALYGLFQ